MFLRSRGLAALTPSPRRSSASALSGSANRGDFSRIMQLEVVDSPRKISNLYRTWCNMRAKDDIEMSASIYGAE
ncbi:hypothetical protein ACMZ79_00240 [Gardnerella vaginalis]|uniref:hypothetical protein n=1 Tax=Gardnerella vaginalis TaxID=2702 RepID=UPI0039EEC5F1